MTPTSPLIGRPPGKFSERDARIVAAFVSGATTTELAREWGLTKMRISQILKSSGTRRQAGGAYARRRMYRHRGGTRREVLLSPFAERIARALKARAGVGASMSNVVEYMLRVHGPNLTGAEFRLPRAAK